jgi:hypothetical protein
MFTHRRLTLAVALAVAFALVLVGLLVAADGAAAPGADRVRPTAIPGAKVGRVMGTNAYVALAFDGQRLRAYVCDGAAGRPPAISRWFRGRWDGRSPIVLAAGGFELRVGRVHADGRATGVLHGFRGSHAFTVRPAAGPAGLYDGRDARRGLRVTWIVLADRSVRGAMADPRPRKCRPVQVTLADGTTQIVTVCKL